MSKKFNARWDKISIARRDKSNFMYKMGQITIFLLLPKNFNGRRDTFIMHGEINVSLSTRWDKN